jgi:hypothetical protein
LKRGRETSPFNETNRDEQPPEQGIRWLAEEQSECAFFAFGGASDKIALSEEPE